MRTSPIIVVAALIALTACGGSTSPSTATKTASSHPSALSSTATVPIADWIDYSWPKAGFAVKLPRHPKSVTRSTKFDSIEITVREVGISDGPHKGVLVGSVHFGARIPTAHAQAELRSSLYSFTGMTAASIKSDFDTKFHGLLAHQAVLKAPHGSYDLIGILKDPSDEVIVLAPQGAIYAAVIGSLRLL